MAADAPTLVLFWSYKGGQGRTWACANIALDLAFRGGARVLVLDLDFKAPGLHYYFRPFTPVEPEKADFGLVDGLVRWYAAYCNSALGENRDPRFDYTDPARFEQLLAFERVPERNERIPGEGWWSKWSEEDAPDRGDSLLRRREENPVGGLAEVLTAIDLEILRQEIAAEEPDLLSAQVGELWLAHCGDVLNADFRKGYGEGFPWRVLADPRSARAREAPITLGDAFYAAAAYLARQCGAEYVLVDLPAGVSNLSEQLIDPIFGDESAPRGRFQWGEPSGLVVVTSLAHQALAGSAALLRGQLVEPPPGTIVAAGGYRPRVVRERRATVLYNLLHENLISLREVVDRHSRETGIPVNFPSRSVLPLDGFEIHPKLGMSEWLVLLPEARHSYVGTRVIPRDELAALRVKALNALEAWTRTDYRRRGQVPRLRAIGDFWAEHRVEVEEIPPVFTLAGEDVPALDAFVAQLLAVWNHGRSRTRLTVYRFDHQDLFDSLELSETVNSLRASLGFDEVRQLDKLPLKVESSGSASSGGTSRLSLGELWRSVDAIAIPHYLLGRASGWGVLDLELALGTGARETLEQQVEGFDELCCHRGVWCAFPFSVLAKLVFSRLPLSADRRRFVDLHQAAGVEQDAPWILTEAKADSLSLWYEWEQLLVSSGGKLVTHTKGGDVGRVIDGTPGSPAVDAVYRCIELYWGLVRSQRREDVGKIDWTNAADRFARHAEYRFRLGWSDWSSQLSASRQAETERRAEKPAAEAGPLHFASLPVEDVSSPRQPLEGWVLVIPEPAAQPTQGLDRRQVAGALQLAMTREWQREYQRQGGCTAFTSVLRDPEVRAAQPWLPFVSDAVRGAIPKGKNRTAPEYARAVTTFLTFVLFHHPEHLEVAASPEILRERFDRAWPLFHRALLRLRYEERLT